MSIPHIPSGLQLPWKLTEQIDEERNQSISLSLSLSDLLAKSVLDAPNHAKATKIHDDLQAT